MPLQATSGAASYDGFGGGVAVVPTYIEDVMSTYVYTGTGATQTITNGIDTTTYGGLVWTKARYLGISHRLVDTARGATYEMSSDTTDASSVNSTGLTSFGTTGYTIGSAGGYNNSGGTYVSWTFREQPKFFDVVTYTGNGVAGRTVAHNLGSVPGFMIVKNTTSTTNWFCWHRTMPNTDVLRLNSTIAQYDDTTAWNSTTPTSTVFTVGTSIATNNTGDTYVAYLFAHDAGGFGLTGTDNVISCGSFTTDGSANATVTLGYEPQWVLVKNTSATENWFLIDTMRGWNVADSSRYLRANTSGVESGQALGSPTATGFTFSGFSASNTYIYIAIRRGPMQVPTLGTSVFQPYNVADTTTQTVGFPTDMYFDNNKTGAPYNTLTGSRLIGTTRTLSTSSTDAETTSWGPSGSFASNTTFAPSMIGAGTVWYSFRRAPGFFDEVCYTGTGSALNPTHSLGVTPELKIIKSRSGAVAWIVGGSVIGGGVNFYMFLETNAIVESTNYWSSGSDSATTFSTRAGNSTSNSSGQTYVAYLFATCAGVSKVFSYTGNGSSQTINCGFTGGARFVLIKRTDSTGDWYVWDSARGIVAGNDPHLSLNTTAAEVTTDDSVDTDTTGFIVNQVAATNVNVSSATYIGLAIA